jgi:predicted metal-dependent hydrolase
MLRWVIKRVRARRPSKSTRRAGLLQYSETARKLVHERLEHFNQFYKFTFNDVRIKSHQTRWGSCSSKGNLNFNYKIALLPPELADYIIVHELCHLGEFNHSQSFWNLVGKTIPNYLELRKSLREVIMNAYK